MIKNCNNRIIVIVVLSLTNLCILALFRFSFWQAVLRQENKVAFCNHVSLSTEHLQSGAGSVGGRAGNLSDNCVPDVPRAFEGHNDVPEVPNPSNCVPQVQNCVPEVPNCVTGVPCLYPELVDFRIIVLTYNRVTSLRKLLRTLNAVTLDGDTGRLEIWIDRRSDGSVSNKTVQTARLFRWTQGPSRVHVQQKHVGIYGQWIDTWSPAVHYMTSRHHPVASPRELALILEDDISVSPFIYRWIKAVHRHYGQRSDFVGCSLTSDELTSHDGLGTLLSAPRDHTVFMYKCIGTWGFAPSPQRWQDFQTWFHATRIENPDFRPYVPGITPTIGYKTYEREGKADSMWEMWMVYFTYRQQLYTVYNNLMVYVGNTKCCLCINRREVGLHFSKKGREDFCEVLKEWRDDFIKFPKTTLRLDWNGKPTEFY